MEYNESQCKYVVQQSHLVTVQGIITCMLLSEAHLDTQIAIGTDTFPIMIRGSTGRLYIYRNIHGGSGNMKAIFKNSLSVLIPF